MIKLGTYLFAVKCRWEKENRREVDQLQEYANTNYVVVL